MARKMNEKTLEWIQELIAKNNVHEFYVSPVWRRMQAQILKENHFECERCKKKGLVVKATTVHHRKYLRQYPELALDPNNLESICKRCHYNEHHRKKPEFTNQERW